MTIRSSFTDYYDYAAYFLGEDTFFKREINNRELTTESANGYKRDSAGFDKHSFKKQKEQ